MLGRVERAFLRGNNFTADPIVRLTLGGSSRSADDAGFDATFACARSPIALVRGGLARARFLQARAISDARSHDPNEEA